MATAHLPESIERPLLALDRQVRDAVFTRGIARLALVVAVGLAACLAGDWLLCLNGYVRGGLLAAWGLVVALIAWFQVLRPMFRPLSLAELAAIVEGQHPELKERLTSLVEFREAGVAPGASRLMRELMAKQTVKAVERLDLSESVPTNRSPRMAFAAVVACGLLFTPFLFDSHGYGLLWARFFAPWGNFNWGSLELLVPGGDQVAAKGSDVPIRIEVRSRAKSATGLDQTVVWLHWTDTTGVKDSRRLEWDADSSRFTTTLPHLFHGIEFHAATRGALSRTHKVHVADPPSITRLHLDVSPPAYTGLPAKALDGAQGEVRTAERSRIAMQFEFSEPVSSASLVWPAEPTTDSGDKAAAKEKLLPIKLSSDKRSATVEALALTSGSFAVRLKNALGLANDDPSRTLVVDPDLPPGVSLHGNDEPVAVRPDDRHMVKADIHDDYGLTAVELHLETSTGQKRIDALPIEALRERKFLHEFPIDIADLALTPGQAVTYRLRAVDNRPVPQPQETWTKPRTLMIQSQVTPTPDQQLAEQQKEVDEQLAKLRDDLADAKEALQKLHAQTEKESLQQKNSDKSKQLEQLERQQAEIVERLQQLAAELAEHRLTEKLAEKAANIAERDLTEAMRKLDEAKKTAESRDQLAPLSQSIDRLAAADKQLQTLQRQLDELQRLEQDLTELDRLANNTERLAERLEQLDQQTKEAANQQAKADTKPNAAPPNNAAATEEQRQQLQAEGEKLAQELNDLLKKHPELLDAARQDQLERLEQLAEQARELTKPQQQLAEAFQQAAENAPASAAKPMNQEEGEKGRQGEGETKSEPANGGEQPAANKPMADQPQTDSSPVSEPKPASEQAKAEAAQAEAGAQAVRQQQQLAQEATRQALKLAKEQGADSEATQAAVEFAKRAAEAARQAQTGQLDKAAEQAQAAAQAAEQAAKELAPAGQPANEKSQQASALAQRQEQLAEQLQQLAPSEAAERGAQQQGQQQLAQATEALAQRLEQAAENLASSPLDSKPSGEAASRAQQAASEAKQSMQQAAQAAKSDDAQGAAEQASRAAQQLQQAAENAQAGQPATPSNSVVPEEVAAQVADAVRQLQKAQQQLAESKSEQAGSNPSNNSEQGGQPSSPPNGNTPSKEPGAPGEGQPSGQPSQGKGQPESQPSSPDGQPQAGSPDSKSQPSPSGPSKEGSPGAKPDGNQPGSPKQPGASTKPGESGQPGSDSKPSSSGQTQPGAGSPAQGEQPGQGPPGEGQPGGKGGGSQLAQSADQFRQAAATMRRALHGEGEADGSNGQGAPKGQGKPGRSMQAQANGEPAPPGEPGAAMANGGGEADPADLGQLDTELKKQAQRNWGKLPGSLRTEILQGASKKPHPEYAKQIKSYFEEIAKPAVKESGK